jgi:hypothetical protein
MHVLSNAKRIIHPKSLHACSPPRIARRYEWMLNLRGLLYYSYDQKHTYTQGMYLIGEQTGEEAWTAAATSVGGQGARS